MSPPSNSVASPPNPKYGQLQPVDYLNLLYFAVRMLAFELPWFVLSYLTTQSGRGGKGLGDSLGLYLIRRISTLLTVNSSRWLTDLGEPEDVLSSKRYQQHRQNLFQQVSEPSFSGVWIVRSSITRASNPKDSDITILYLHGGGYYSSSPATYLLSLLRLAESIITRGKAVSIFALDYKLAPEYTFPSQLREATAAYSWLLEDVGIRSSKLLVAGDSAGGHLALSLMNNLHIPHNFSPSDGLVIKETLEKPELGLVLTSPWLSLSHAPQSFIRNETTDVLSADFLTKTAKRFLGPVQSSNWPLTSPYVEFLNPSPPIDWNIVLPPWTWVSAGRNEIMHDDILIWTHERQTTCGQEVCFELDEEEAHVYAWLETTDPAKAKAFLGKPYEEGVSEPDFKAIDRMGRILVDRIISAGT